MIIIIMILIFIHKRIPQRKSHFKHPFILYGEFLWTPSDYRLFGAEHNTSINLSAALLPVMVPPVLLVMFICSWPFPVLLAPNLVITDLIVVLASNSAIISTGTVVTKGLDIVFMVSLATKNSKYTFADQTKFKMTDDIQWNPGTLIVAIPYCDIDLGQQWLG